MTAPSSPTPQPLNSDTTAPTLNTPRCPECGITESPQALARPPWLIRNLPALAVAAVLTVMLALTFIPRLTSPRGNWLPSWDTDTWSDGFYPSRSFVGHGYRIADIRALLDPDAPKTRPEGDFARALAAEVSKRNEPDPAARINFFTQPFEPVKESRSIFGWPIAWQTTSSSLYSGDPDGRGALLNDPRYSLNNRRDSIVWNLTDVQQRWIETGPGGLPIGYWDRIIYLPVLLAPIMLLIAALEVVRIFAARSVARESRRADPPNRQRPTIKSARWIVIPVVLALTAAGAAVRTDKSIVLPALSYGTRPQTPLISITNAEFDHLSTSENADRLLAERIISAVTPEVPDNEALFLATNAGQTEFNKNLWLSYESSFAGRWLLQVSEIQRFNADGTAVPSRVRGLTVEVKRGPNTLEIHFRTPLDPTTRVRVSIGLDPLLFWLAIAIAAMYTARLIRHLYRRRITTRRHRKGECLQCRYHLRPTSLFSVPPTARAAVGGTGAGNCGDCRGVRELPDG